MTDGTARGQAKLSALKERIGIRGVPAESWIRRQRVIAEEVKCCAMEIIASGPCDDVYRPRVGGTGRKIEISGRDLKLLDDLLRKTHLRTERSHRHNAAAINRDPRSTSSRSGIPSGRSQHRHKHAIVVARRRGLHTRFEF